MHLVQPRHRRVVQGGVGRTLDDRRVIAGEAVLGEQLADFHLDQLKQFGIVNKIDLVEEADDLGHADLTGEQDVLAGLRHGSVGGRHDQDRAVHLGGAGDHVLDVVGVTRTVHVGIVPGFGLILDVGGGDGHRLGGVAFGAALGDVLVILGGCPELGLRAGAQRGGQGRLAMVDVTDGSDVYVGFFTFEYTFGHDRNLQILSFLSSAKYCPRKPDSPQELAQGLEPWTSTLPRWRSTTELCQRHCPDSTSLTIGTEGRRV